MTRMAIEVCIIFAAISGLPAQESPAAEKAAALKQSLAANQAALRTYTWTETTEISLKGEVKKREQKSCIYGPDGKVQKTLISAPSPPPQQQSSGRGGRLKQKIVENKKDEMQDYMQQAAALIQQYVPPDGEKIAAAAKSGNASLMQSPPAGVLLVFKNYVKPNDVFTIGLDQTSKAIQSLSVDSYLDKDSDKVTLAVTFAKLPDGTNHTAQTVLDAKAKNIKVVTTNSGYRKIGG